MTPHNRGGPRPLWRTLWWWVLGTIVALWCLLAGVAYYTGFHEAEEISDGLLVSMAELLLQHPGAPAEVAVWGPATAPMASPPAPDPYASAYAPKFQVLVWQGARLVWDSHGVASQLPAHLPLGHQTLRLALPGQATGPVPQWRVFVAESRTPGDADPEATRRVLVMLDRERREALGADVAEHIVSPALLFLPLVAVLLAWAIRRGLQPLQRLSDQILALDVNAGQTLTAPQAFQELQVATQAINQLVQRLTAQIGRERRFAADVAHELRTPLTSLVLQSRLARDPTTGAQRQAMALLTVEQDAMRAGRILSQLLDLARAEAQPDDAGQTVDLCALAREVVTAHVALAHALGQDIALEAPQQAIRLPGSATLLALALRNLVDNALRHNPAGTDVEVKVGLDEAGRPMLAVSDDGLPLPAALPHSQAPDATVPLGTPFVPGAWHGGSDMPSSQVTDPVTLCGGGLGIGLTLVERIAHSQGAQLLQGPAAAPLRKRYALVWPAVGPRDDWATRAK